MRRGARAPGEVEGDRGRGDEAARGAGDQRAIALARDLGRDVADEGDPGDDDGHQPQLIRVERLVGPVALVRQHRQRDEGHGQQDQRGAKLRPGQHPDPAVQPLLGGEQRRRRHRCRGGRDHVAEHRERAEREGEEHGDQRRHADDALALGLAPAEERRRPGKRQEREPHRRRPDLLREQPPHAAEQAGQREGAQARGPLAFLLLALAPAALDADQEADGKRQPEPRQGFGLVHPRAQSRAAQKAGGCPAILAGNASASIIIRSRRGRTSFSGNPECGARGKGTRAHQPSLILAQAGIQLSPHDRMPMKNWIPACVNEPVGSFTFYRFRLDRSSQLIEARTGRTSPNPSPIPPHALPAATKRRTPSPMRPYLVSPILTSWTRRLIAASGLPASSGSSSPTPTANSRFGATVKVVTSASRIACDRARLSLRL